MPSTGRSFKSAVTEVNGYERRTGELTREVRENLCDEGLRALVVFGAQCLWGHEGVGVFENDQQRPAGIRSDGNELLGGREDLSGLLLADHLLGGRLDLAASISERVSTRRAARAVGELLLRGFELSAPRAWLSTLEAIQCLFSQMVSENLSGQLLAPTEASDPHDEALRLESLGRRSDEARLATADPTQHDGTAVIAPTRRYKPVLAKTPVRVQSIEIDVHFGQVGVSNPRPKHRPVANGLEELPTHRTSE